MCGRYTLFTDDEYSDIQDIIRSVQDKLDEPLRTGEIFPTNLAPVLAGDKQKSVCPQAAVWGFPNFRGSGVIINARSETAAEKKMFQKPLMSSRCIVPCTGFYEWDSGKKKYLFNLPETGEMYLAGLCGDYVGTRRYVILTTSANTSVEDIHNRMPVIIPKNKIEEWICDTQSALMLLQSASPVLVNREV